MHRDLFHGLKQQLEFDLGARQKYESRVVSKSRILDVGGRNDQSISRRQIQLLNNNPRNTIICTDIIPEYGPDLIDDICHTSLKAGSFDGVYCVAILEHVTEYWRAIDNIYEILAPGGEAFFYVPFFYPFHDQMDHHRFTFTEMFRMLNKFSEKKIIMPGKESGYGYVFWYLNTLSAIARLPRLHTVLARLFNLMFKLVLFPVYKMKSRSYSFHDFAFFYIHLAVNHGFCAWVKK